MKPTVFTATLAAALLSGAGAFAGQMSAAPTTTHWSGAKDTPQQHMQGKITFVSGGVGAGNRNAMRQVENRYNLHLMFAVQRSGDYLANVGVKLANTQGKTVLHATSNGPFFFANVPAGHYKITVMSQGRPLTRDIAVAAHGISDQIFYWPAMSAS